MVVMGSVFSHNWENVQVIKKIVNNKWCPFIADKG